MLSYIIIQLCNLYSLIIFIYCLMSWFPVHRPGILRDIYLFLGRLCDPYLNIFRRIIPTIGMIDISPIIALIVLQLVVRLIVFLI
ncbi:MAG: YggT family protein [Eggerthellaceae bacterium]|nr:YggT family protein [Eggerthellaceae bacterium]